MNPFGMEFAQFPVRGHFQKKLNFFSTSCDFTSPQLRNDYRPAEIRYQNNSLRDV